MEDVQEKKDKIKIQAEEGIKFDDAQIQRLLGKCNVAKPHFTCAKGHNINFVCISAKCQNPAFICHLCDKKTHHKCVKYQIDIFYQLMIENMEKKSQAFKQIYQLGIKMINQFKQCQQKLAQNLALIGYDQKAQSMMSDVFKKGQIDKYSGSDFNNLKEILFNCNQYKQSFYIKELQPISKAIQTLILQKIPNIFQNNPCNISSNILNHQDQYDFIKQSLSYNHDLKSLKLLFTASQNQFIAQKFHQKCDNIQNTLTIIRTQSNKILAGFTPLKWNQVVDSFAADPSKQTFILQVDLKQKMRLNTLQKAIYCSKSNGPSFGYHDILIQNKCSITDCTFDFADAFNFQQKPYPKQSQQSYNAFIGLSQNKTKVLQYEVYKVQFNNQEQQQS